MKRISIIVAMAKNRVIGRNNELPWKISEDLRRFKDITMGKSVVMGRKTFDSIGRPLPGRQNIVITRQMDYRPEGVQVASSYENALTLATSDEVFIIGGGEIYQKALLGAHRLYLTEIESEVDGDTFFPDFNRNDFVEIEKSSLRTEPVPYRFLVLERQN